MCYNEIKNIYKGAMEMNVSEINRIKDTLNSKSEKKYYVYMLCDETNTPFYIGKGAGEWTIVKKVDRGMRKISKAQPRHARRTKVQSD